MELPINPNTPLIMHIDLDSCFATVAQQGFVHLRGKPLVIAAYNTANGCVLSPSIEAKRFGVKTGMTVRQSRMLCPDVIVRTPDPPMIRDVHLKFRTIFSDYSPSVTPKSIDEAVLDFTGMEHLIKRDLTDIGREIKKRMRQEIGEWISASVGVGTSRFLAKTAASFKKPDGLFMITPANIRSVYEKLSLVDLNGINTRFQARLNMANIFTPLQFLDAPLATVQKQVFQSVNGYYWYCRLRGWEVDSAVSQQKTYGQDYALQKHTNNPEELATILMKLTEKMGRRLRKSGQAARGVHVAVIYDDWTHWHTGKKFNRELYTTQELYRYVLLVFNMRPANTRNVRKLMISCYDLTSAQTPQMNLFDLPQERARNVSDALDKINDKYGEFVITPALMMSMDEIILDRIAFGSVRELRPAIAPKT